MKHYDVVGYTYDGKFYCLDCALDCDLDINADGCGPVYAGSEWDNAPVCTECGVECEDVTVLNDEENDILVDDYGEGYEADDEEER